MKCLAALDMDGTILKERSIDVLTSHCHLKKKLRTIDTKYRNLKEYQKSEKIARFFKGYRANQLLEIFRTIPLNDGTIELINYLKQNDFLVAIISDSYTFLIEDLARRLKIEHFFGNVLEAKEGIFTGKMRMPWWGGSQDCDDHSVCKLGVIKKLVKENNVSESCILAVGDSDADYCMLEYAKFAVAYGTKGRKLDKIPNIIRSNDFHEVLAIFKTKLQNLMIQ
jgi:HAD superfamily phosphoserine phosphatase-like hydrolase